MKTRRSPALKNSCLITLLCAVLAQVSFGQEMPQGTAEVTGFGGGVFGIGSHGTVGGSVGYAATNRLIVLGEFSYIPLGGGETRAGGITVTASARAFDLNGGVHYSFPTNNSKALPYVAGGVGLLRGSGDVEILGLESFQASSTSFFVNLGAGVRYKAGEHWGIRPELKVFAGDDTFVRLAVGVFYQWSE